MAWVEKYVSASAAGGGDGSSGTPWTLAEAIANAAAGNRLNVQAGTYANTSTVRTFATAGTTTAPVWWRGYNAAIGDLDADPVTAKPALTFTTGGCNVTGSHQYFSNLSVTSARTTNPAVLVSTGSNIQFDRCRVESTGANAASNALSTSATGAVYTRCWFKSTSSADVVAVTATTHLAGCVVTGGGSGINASAQVTVSRCSVNTVGAHGVVLTPTTMCVVLGNTIYGAGTDGVRVSTLPTAQAHLIADNLIANCGGYGLNNSTGANTNFVHRSHNDFYLCTSGPENGFGDSPAFAQQLESSSPFVTPGTNQGLVAGALARATALPAPGVFENQSYTGYGSIGAVQPNPAGGGGGILLNPGLGGGLQ